MCRVFAENTGKVCGKLHGYDRAELQAVCQPKPVDRPKNATVLLYRGVRG